MWRQTDGPVAQCLQAFLESKDVKQALNQSQSALSAITVLKKVNAMNRLRRELLLSLRHQKAEAHLAAVTMPLFCCRFAIIQHC
jgi:hypothetical protein